MFVAEHFFLTDPEMKDDIPLALLSHKDMYEQTIRKATKIFVKIRQLQSEGNDGVDNYLYGGNPFCISLISTVRIQLCLLHT